MTLDLNPLQGRRGGNGLHFVKVINKAAPTVRIMAFNKEYDLVAW